MAVSQVELGRRLRELREAIGFTQSYVANKLDVHRPTISEIEAGRRAVTSEELARFAQLYATRIDRLLSQVSSGVDEAIAVLCRGAGVDRPDTKRAIRRFVERCREERELEQLLGLALGRDARPDYGMLPPRSKIEAIQMGEHLADKERERLELGAEPLRGVLSLLQRQGVTIGPLPDGNLNYDLDGFFLEANEVGPCVAVNLKASDVFGYRATFTGAHEYAHWLLRDKQVELLPRGAPGDNDFVEIRANTFAAAFLMPKAGLRKYLTTQGILNTDNQRAERMSAGDVVRAMDYFGVSRLALLYRLVNVGFITEAVRRDLNTFTISTVAHQLGIELGTREPMPERLPTLAIHAWRSGLIGASRAAELCGKELPEFKRFVAETGELPDAASDVALLGVAAE